MCFSCLLFNMNVCVVFVSEYCTTCLFSVYTINIIIFFTFISGIYVLLASTDHLSHLSLGQKGTILTYISSVIYFNCIANPLIYACKIKKVRRYIRKTFKMRDKVTYITEFDLKSGHEVAVLL